MIAFPVMLVPAAREVGMKVPTNPEHFNKQEFPHFSVFCKLQIGTPMPTPGCHHNNAKIIAALSETRIRKITVEEIRKLGFMDGYAPQ